jgi:PAP2 superfamily protein
VAPSLRRRLIPIACGVVCLLWSSLALRAQDDSLRDADSSLDAVSADSARAAPQATVSAPAASRDVSVGLLPANFLRDQEAIWLFPRELAAGRHWAPTVTVAAATFALLSADPHVQPLFNHTRAFRGFDRVFTSRITGVETMAFPAALYAVGLERGDSYMRKTALFATEAVLDSEVVRMFLNTVTTRWRPQDIFTRRTYSDTFFHSISHVGSSFPSGHTIAAVSVATIIARRYRNHRWVPWAAYGLAGTIGLSRISLRAHFPSDVFLGSVLGYAIARYDVLQNQ